MLKYRKSKAVYLLLGVLLSGLLQACLKEEYMPPPVGEALPYTDSLSYSIEDTLGNGPFTTFYYAWRTSGVGERLSTDGKMNFTLLVPSNQAMEDAGWTVEAIESASTEQLETLVLPHIFSGRISQSELQSISGSYRAQSLYVYPGIRQASNLKPHVFTAQMTFKETLLVNGKSLGAAPVIETSNGAVWPVNQVLQAPQLAAWDLLKADPRFSMYVALLEYTDAWYRDLFIAANGYAPEDGNAAVQAYARNSPLYYDLALDVLDGQPLVGDLNTWFIPSNAAFQAAGFQDLDDLIAFNMEHGLPQTEEVAASPSYFGLIGDFPTDSLLDYHDNWGRRIGDYDLTRKRNATVFYSTDLNQQAFNAYPISALTEIEYGYYFPMMGHTVFHLMPLAFGEDQVWIKGQAGAKAQLIESDIPALNGVIHVVDALLIPEQYK